jgi:DNA-binding PadR family transcriptional regulator
MTTLRATISVFTGFDGLDPTILVYVYSSASITEDRVATKRKVDNLTGLAVLATVVQRPMHRYEMASIMRARGKDKDMDVKWGSLYTVVGNLAKHGFLEAIETTRQGARPERTVYRITDAGRQELLDWTRELLAVPQRERARFTAGLSVLAVLAPDDVIGLLQTRLGKLEDAIASERAEVQNADVPRLFLIENEYLVAMLEAETAWIRSLLAELESGTYPYLADWRKWHATGEMSAALAELAERGATPQ